VNTVYSALPAVAAFRPRRAFSSFVPVATLLLLALGAAARADFSFVHITDTHVTASEAEGSAAQKDGALFKEIAALSPRPAFVVNTGDVVEAGTPDEYAVYRKTLAANLSGGALTLPVYAAPGNHDVRWNPLGKEGYVKGTGQPRYQSWTRENVHFILLDSTVVLQHWGHFDQQLLDWLKADLARTGARTPIVVGFHHWIGRGTTQVDNQQALLDLLAPYNVRLFLIGHGHSDLLWSVNGVPAVMAKGLYQGSYHLVQVSRNRLRVLRRTTERPTPNQEIVSVPLQKPETPRWDARVTFTEGRGVLSAGRGTLPADARLEYRVDDGEEYRALRSAPTGWTADLASEGLLPGEHVVTVQASLPDGRAYQLPVRLSLAGRSTTVQNGVTRVTTTPAPIWTTNVGGEVQGKVITSGSVLLVPSMGGALVALDAATGRELWRVKTGGPVFSTPHADAATNTVYFGSADHDVYAADLSTGAVKWRAKTGGAVFAGAATAGGVVCIASADTTIYGLDQATGKTIWTAPGGGLFQSKAATDGARFYVGGWDNFLRALDVKTGKEVWKNKFGTSFYFAPAIASPAVGGGRVYVSSNDGLLHAMEAQTGKVVWETPALKLGYSSPLFANDRIYNASLTGDAATGAGVVYCFDAATGKTLWSEPTGSVIYDSSCALGGGNVYVGAVDGTFSALTTADGFIAWQVRLAPGHVFSSPATDAARVYIGSMNGTVSAFPLSGGTGSR